MSRKIVIFDTSILCCLLAVPSKETAGSGENRWDKDRTEKFVADSEGSTFVLPLTTIIETGNHIAQAPHSRFDIANKLGDLIRRAAQAETPWAAFVEQSDLWTPANLIKLAGEWPALAVGGTSIGDATIKDVADYYAKSGCQVTIATADAALKAYEPSVPTLIPRRRGGRE